ncbi:DUF1269 domain-containing protein [Paenibacillus shenyangensis]|uniref:DUF1269 domain-containing protein n=1 Tax=Paenibacillus sp. A9 TaxID=1284352 RepID=UPI00037B87CC|nr:DUF1269 domain-containing protein [Paenibacillus sp. A9]
MENVMTVVFKEESKTYQALSELKNLRLSEQFTVLEAAIVKKEGGQVQFKDGFSADGAVAGKWITGGLLGSLIGILGGPLGVLLGGSIGSMIGASIAADKLSEDVGMIQATVRQLDEGQLALIAIVQEENMNGLNQVLNPLDPAFMMRREVNEVSAEVDQARQVERELEKEARERMRSQRLEEFKDKAEDIRDRVREQFDKLKQRF